MDKDHNKFLVFQINRNIINLSKDFLNVLEGLRDDNVISAEYYTKLRSRILGKANDRIRELEEIIDEFTVELIKK